MPATRSELVPDPRMVAALVEQLVEGAWPRSVADREKLFKRLQFTSGDRLDRAVGSSPPASAYALATGLPGDVFASWSAWKGHWLGIGLHLYTFPQAESPYTRAGHDAVWDRLTGLYGRPVRLVDDEPVRPSLWQANGREIATHFFHRRDSALMLTISDAELSAEAAAGESYSLRNPDSGKPRG